MDLYSINHYLMKTKPRVVVGLSGGVDSSVAAKLLIDQGYEVIGMFMKNWHDESVTISNECPWLEDSTDAMLVAETLNIPFQAIDLSAEYQERIVDYMFAEYSAGRTPNPDILCNREIKFDIFLKAAIQLKADFVATGHYCQKGVFMQEGKPTYQLLAGADANKDQSYFLCQLSQGQLAKALFPIGHLQKSEVREIAKQAGLITAEKKDSQGLCFIGKVRLPDFLQQQLKPKTGKIIQIPEEFPAYHSQLISFGNSSSRLDPRTVGIGLYTHFLHSCSRKSPRRAPRSTLLHGWSAQRPAGRWYWQTPVCHCYRYDRKRHLHRFGGRASWFKPIWTFCTPRSSALDSGGSPTAAWRIGSLCGSNSLPAAANQSHPDPVPSWALCGL